ncbi:DUF4267 domain-containing protein [Streptomyces halstedii]|uniref:DUF4267 domain-containing protein n=1 Tax=Streptomyces halstedii TaxID=1944 RepID=UPI0037F36AF3
MLTWLAHGLAVVLNLLIVVVGLRFFLQPQAAAAGYGVPAREASASAYLTIKGLRDLVSGLIGFALLVFAADEAEAWFMLVVALTPLGDTVIVLRNGGTKAVAFGVHFATAVLVLVCSGLLFAL